MVEEVSTRDSDPLLDNRVESPVRSSEIVDSAPCCRVFLESDGEPEEELISNCMCKGTQQFVHSSCLDHWRSVKEGFAFTHCTTCKAQFHLQVQPLEDNSCRKIKFRIFVAQDVLLVFWLYKPLLLNWVAWHTLWTKMGTSEIHLMTVGTASYQNIPYLFITV